VLRRAAQRQQKKIGESQNGRARGYCAAYYFPSRQIFLGEFVMALNLQQLRAGSAVNHLAVVVSTKEELTTLNSVKERGSHGALRSQLSTSPCGVHGPMRCVPFSSASA